MSHYTYLILNILVFCGPALASFDQDLRFFKFWPRAACSIICTATPFLFWDMLFTHWGVWSFNNRYTLEARLLGLPYGEVLFFFSVPFACLFLYKICVHFDWRLAASWRSTALIAALIMALGIYNYDKTYTFTACVLTSLLFLKLFSRTYFKHLLVAYLLHLPGFLIINGLLTALPVVLYNNSENLNLRLYSIPVEDFLYSFLILGSNVWSFEWICSTTGSKDNHEQK